jgi:hypothetical protein
VFCFTHEPLIKNKEITNKICNFIFQRYPNLRRIVSITLVILYCLALQGCASSVQTSANNESKLTKKILRQERKKEKSKKKYFEKKFKRHRKIQSKPNRKILRKNDRQLRRYKRKQRRRY